jgi:hypothetical protein
MKMAPRIHENSKYGDRIFSQNMAIRQEDYMASHDRR